MTRGRLRARETGESEGDRVKVKVKGREETEGGGLVLSGDASSPFREAVGLPASSKLRNSLNLVFLSSPSFHPSLPPPSSVRDSDSTVHTPVESEFTVGSSLPSVGAFCVGPHWCPLIYCFLYFPPALRVMLGRSLGA